MLVHVVDPVHLLLGGLLLGQLLGEEVVVHAELAGQRVLLAHPVDEALHLLGGLLVHALHHHVLQLSAGRAHHLLQPDVEAVAQAHNVGGHHSEEASHVLLREVICVDVDGLGGVQVVGGAVLHSGEHGRLEHLVVVLRHVLNYDLHGLHHRERARRYFIQILAHVVLQQLDRSYVLVAAPSHSNFLAEIVDGLRWVASAPHSVDRQEARVVPPTHILLHH